MKPTRFHREVRRRLQRIADPRVKEGAERYFKHQVKFIGVAAPQLRGVAREVEPWLEGDPERLMAECFKLMHSDLAEEKHVGIALLSRNLKRLPADFLRRLEPVFDQTVSDWGACDHIGGKILRPLIGDSAARKRIVGWRNAKSPWRQRVSAVAFVNEAKRGNHNRSILIICSTLVKNRDRFVQLGMGWVLRELYLADAGAVLSFLRRNYPRINREALRYAIEKMPKALQTTILQEHKLLTA